MRKVLDTPAATEVLPRTRGEYAAQSANAVGHRGPTVERQVCSARRLATLASLARVNATCGSIVSARGEPDARVAVTSSVH